MKKTALIIGAGPAGLTAAYELLTKTDILPIVVETDSQVGGLSKTIDYKGNKIDIGGHRFFSKSPRVIKWWLQFLPLEATASGEKIDIRYQQQQAAFNIAEGMQGEGDKVMLLRPRKSRIYYDRKFFDYPLKVNAKTMAGLGFVKMTRIGFSYLQAKIFPIKPEVNLAQFFTNRFGKELYLTFFKDYTEKVWGVSCESIPSSWGQQRVKDLDISQVLWHAFRSIFSSNKSIEQKGTSTSLIEQFLYPKFGPGQMWESVADEIRRLGGTIAMNSSVNALHCNDAGRIDHVTFTNLNSREETTMNVDYCFSSMPVRELIENLRGIEITPPVKEIAEGLMYRDFLIVGILLRKLAVSENGGLIKDNWIYVQDKNVSAGRIQLFNNWSPFMVPQEGTVWIGVEYFCNETDAFWKQDDNLVSAQAIREMQSIGMLQPADVMDSVVVRVKKAYPSYYGTYAGFDEVRRFLDKIDNLYLIGRNGMHRYNNSDHSMLTAMTAVENLISGRSDKSNIWEINTEEAYHEETEMDV